MKKFLVFCLVLLLLSFCFVGCGDDKTGIADVVEFQFSYEYNENSNVYHIFIYEFIAPETLSNFYSAKLDIDFLTIICSIDKVYIREPDYATGDIGEALYINGQFDTGIASNALAYIPKNTRIPFTINIPDLFTSDLSVSLCYISASDIYNNNLPYDKNDFQEAVEHYLHLKYPEIYPPIYIGFDMQIPEREYDTYGAFIKEYTFTINLEGE